MVFAAIDLDDSDLKCAKIFLRNIVSEFTNTVSDDLQFYECVLCRMFCKLDVRRKSIVTLALS